MSICSDSDDTETELDNFNIPFTFLRKPDTKIKIAFQENYSVNQIISIFHLCTFLRKPETKIKIAFQEDYCV